MWYAVYDKITGELVSTGTVIDIPNLPANLEYKILSAAPDFASQEWDKTAKEMKPKVVIPATPKTIENVLHELASLKVAIQAIKTKVGA